MRRAYSCRNQSSPVKTLSLRQPGVLDELLNYRLLRLQAASGAPVVRLLEGRFGIARREWRLLALLAGAGAMSPSQLAERAHLDRPRTSRAIGSLVKKALVQRAPQPGDARRAHVELSAEGMALYDRVFPLVAALNASVVDALDDATVRVLDEALSKLTERALQVNAEAVRDVQADRRHGGTRRVRPPLD
jgi:DNA-binding MarR family transcriptional regulator